MPNDDERAEDEKCIRVELKYAGYGYTEFYDEMRLRGLQVDLYTDSATYCLETIDGEDVTASARMSRFTHRALDRAARQIRAQLQVDGVVEAWERDG